MPRIRFNLHLTKEEKYFLFFLILCIFTFTLVRYLGLEKFNFQFQSEQSREAISFPLDLNSASFGDLIKVPGIGPTYAEKIIDYRYEKGGFKNISELMQIKGIGKKKLKKLKQYFKL